MDTLAPLFAYVQQWLLTPLWHCLTGLFDFNGRLGLPFLLISGLIAYLLYRMRRRQQGPAAGSFAGFLGGRAIWLHPSALLDYQYYLVRALLHVALIVPILTLLNPWLLQATDITSALTRLWGERPRLAEASWLMMLYGLGVFLVSDFVHYWLHRVFHSRWLWEFHKVHHSATVLVPPTASRIHLVEKLSEILLKGCALALYSGAFYWLCGSSVRPYTLFGVSYLVLIFNSLAANLRHSHIWLSFGPRLEHIFNSPAQHQIHHSRDPRHFNHNFGINLSLWDWWYGTLYVTNHQPEPLTFGVGPKDNVRYSRLGALILRPFLVTARKLWHALPRPRSRKPQPDLR
ncbi:sterol desaturase family protein [Aeromonas sp. HMWF016]|uniref:sterol desaturase family protein n=1 Tax=Aeromonas sp. HMWF016 TaxID=2056852 RepID=UPI000D3969CD|nr:sterol desaturase family protein [Aeromonas sp. HMWF016]PTT46345.1 sterol desaturase [Aeromonas sp. HMWF016]